ncbi:hypothetical protein AGLY_013094 [Aphis glycines]|uniref:Uncharacterized protein n=1 Tax=Aphis glycines TaxID=307491 RepID=A0A6G0T8M1_APHGL|nr:hypothetical protein AGLY_013094 [Aphis glycines]
MINSKLPLVGESPSWVSGWTGARNDSRYCGIAAHTRTWLSLVVTRIFGTHCEIYDVLSFSFKPCSGRIAGDCPALRSHCTRLHDNDNDNNMLQATTQHAAIAEIIIVIVKPQCVLRHDSMTLNIVLCDVTHGQCWPTHTPRLLEFKTDDTHNNNNNNNMIFFFVTRTCNKILFTIIVIGAV